MTSYLFKVLMVSTILCSPLLATAQGMAINTSGSAADNSAMLDVTSTSQGMLVPRMTAAQRTAISLPATGLLVYQTDGTKGFYYNSGTSGTPNWISLTPTATDLTGDVTSTGGVSSYNNIVPTNKGGAGNVNGLLSANGAGTVSAASTTGSGSVVLASSPTLVTPSLGTPTTLVGTNISGTANNLTAGTAKVLATARNINGVAFDGSADITLPGGGGVTNTTLMLVSQGGNTGSTTPYYIAPGHGGNAMPATGTTTTTPRNTSATGVDGSMPMPFACTITALQVASYTAVTGTSAVGVTFTVYKNGAAQTMTVSTSNTTTVGSKDQQADTTHTVTVAAGDVISIRAVENNNNGSTSPYVNYTIVLRTQ